MSSTDRNRCSKCFADSKILVTVRVHSDSYYNPGYHKQKWCLECIQTHDNEGDKITNG